MTGFLLDTNTFVYFFQGRQSVVQFVSPLLKQKHKVFLSTAVYAELCAADLPEQREKIVDLLPFLTVVPVTMEIAECAGTLRRENPAKHKKPYLIDCLIAASAQVNGLTLVTNNSRDFRFSNVKVKKLA